MSIFCSLAVLFYAAIRTEMRHEERVELFEEGKLIGMRFTWDAPMRTIVHAVNKRGVAHRKQLERLLAGASEAHFLPDLVKAARIAPVAAHEVATANPEPARDPDIDGVRFAQRPGRRQWQG